MTGHARSSSFRQRWLVAALCVVSALVGCSSDAVTAADVTDPAPDPQSIDLVTQLEEAIAECMLEAGFTYVRPSIPVEPQTTIAAEPGRVQAFLDSREAPASVEDLVDPAQFETFGEYESYLAALDGDGDQSGCRDRARAEVDAELALPSVLADAISNPAWQRAHEAWQECAAAEGHGDLESPAAFDERIGTQIAEIVGVNPSPELSQTQLEQLAELQTQEEQVLASLKACNRELDIELRAIGSDS